MVSKTIEAWHFLKEDGCLQFSPFSRVKPGKKLTATEQPLKLCAYGLHASLRPIDALAHAPGPIVCRVMLSGEILEGDDKLCATERTCLWLGDATRVLHEFAIWCAQEAIRRTEVDVDPRLQRAIDTKVRWLNGEVYGEALAEARVGAWKAGEEISGIPMQVANTVWMSSWEEAAPSARNASTSLRTSLLAEGDEVNRELEKRIRSIAPSGY